jgi:hypothetical protein
LLTFFSTHLFIHLDNQIKQNLSEIFRKVLAKEALDIYSSDLNNLSVEVLNEKFIRENEKNYTSIYEAAKIVYNLSPDSNRSRALQMITEFFDNNDLVNSKKIDLKVIIMIFFVIYLLFKYRYFYLFIFDQLFDEIFESIADINYFGKFDESFIEKFKLKLKKLFPLATIFQTKEQQAADIIACIQSLSLNTAASSTANTNSSSSSSNATQPTVNTDSNLVEKLQKTNLNENEKPKSPTSLKT